MMSYVCLTSEQDAVSVLQSLIDNDYLVKVIDEQGKTVEKVFGNWQNYIGNFKPGEGYYIKVTEECTLVETCGGSLAKTVARPKSKHYLTPESNPYRPMSIYVSDIHIDGVALDAGDEVAVYDGEHMVGSAVWQNNNQPMLIIARQADDEQVGFEEGQAVQFKIWRAKDDKEIVLSTTDVIPLTENGKKTQQASFRGLASAFVSLDVTTIVSEALPTEFSLKQNYPNPFNPETTIAYDLPEESDVTFDIYDIRGVHIRTLVNENQAAGHYEMKWDGRDFQGNGLASGVYFYKLTANQFSQTHKMIFAK
jgi:flagellar hook assembly protein FlgD